ncbi:BC85_0335 family putative methyltransferase [[Mycoplasma] gypis]|uniref:Uncharacterized protein n=1 Tax=[Mycoplasma] gypis TaxID=92404 RepID=A0ABZ2RNR2_9BACT|nr:hypothetical protein [[Mycoplasma] gypis]MBN0919466.1 hypothetical protein [[Mycoplasma] gypis]
MKNNLIVSYAYSISEKIQNWQPWKTGLLISLFVVMIIGIIGFIVFRKRVKKLKEKYELENENKIFLEASEQNPNFSTIFTELEKKTKNSKANKFFTAFVVNSYLINKFKSAYIDDKVDNYFALNIAMNSEKSTITYQDYQNLREIKTTPNAIKVAALDKKQDMLVLLNPHSEEGIKDLKQNLIYLEDRGMCIFVYNKYNKKEVKKITDFLEDNKYSYEKEKIKSLHFILIAKKQEIKE